MPLIREELQRWRLPRPGPLLHDLSQVLYLPFDHDDGSYARDRSGYNNHGTLYGPTRVAGKVADALSFDGVDDYVEVPYSDSINPKKAITFEGWAIIDNISLRRISGSKENHYRWLDFEAGTGKYYWHVGDGVGWYFATVETWTLPVGSWFHLAYVVNWENGWAKVYLNGVEKSSATFTAGAIGGNTNNLYIGSHSPIGYFWLGENDEVRIYNRTLSQAEIRRLMYMRGV